MQTVAAGSDTFGLADGAAIVPGAARGVPVRAVMGIMNRSPTGEIVRKDSGITTLAGLNGQTIAATTGEAGLTVFPAVMRSQKLPPDSIRFLLAAREPDAAIAALMAVKPTLDRDLSMAQFKTGLPLMRSGHGADKPTGWMAPEDWAGTLALMKEFQGLQTDMPASAFWTDAFLPK